MDGLFGSLYLTCNLRIVIFYYDVFPEIPDFLRVEFDI